MSPETQTELPDKEPVKKKVRVPRTRKPVENPAAEILVAKGRKEMTEKAAKLEQENRDNLFYLRCPRHVEHHAIYLTERPMTRIHPGHWFSIEHRAGDPWIYARVQCQECLADGDPEVYLWLKPFLMEDGNVSFTMIPPPDTQMVFSVPRAELENRLGMSIEDMMGEAEGGE